MVETALNEAERAEMARKAMAAIEEGTRMLAALGIETVAEDEPVKAPDGAPTSKAHTILKPRILPVCRVRLLESDGHEAIINSAEFDPEIHERIETAKRTRTTLEDTKPAPVFGTHTRDELLAHTVPALLAMPEVALIEGEAPEKKEELVVAILDVREDQA